MSLSNKIGLHTNDNSFLKLSAHNLVENHYVPVLNDVGNLANIHFNHAAAAGANIVRIPISMAFSDGPNWLNAVTSPGVDKDYSVYHMVEKAKSQGLKVILEPGQTPRDLMPSYLRNLGFFDEGHPPTVELIYGQQTGVDIYAQRLGALASALENSSVGDAIVGWEIGNEPNLSYSSLGNIDGTNWAHRQESVNSTRPYAAVIDQAGSSGLTAVQEYSLLLFKASEAIKLAVPTTTVIAAGIAHNDISYMNAMLSELSALQQQFNSYNVDSFSVHPYTTHGKDAVADPHSSRATDLSTDTLSGNYDVFDNYFNFELALENYRNLLDQFGYSDKNLWVTEFGVPSYNFKRGAGGLDGSEGETAQAQFFAEAFGIFDSISGFDGIIAHNAYDNYVNISSNQSSSLGVRNNNHIFSSLPDGIASNGEGSFGVYRVYGNGSVDLKPAGNVLQSVAAQTSNYMVDRGIIIETGSTTGNINAQLNLSAWNVGSQVVLTFDGDDSVVGTRGNDALFGGDGKDQLSGFSGNDRIYGGQGNDEINGGSGDDRLDGGDGNDLLSGGIGSDRYSYNRGEGFDIIKENNDAGFDQLFINGYSDTGLILGRNSLGDLIIRFPNAGNQIVGEIVVRGQFSAGSNAGIEKILFDDSAAEWSRSQIDEFSRSIIGGGNGSPIATPDNDIAAIYGQDTNVNVLANDYDPDGNSLIISKINGFETSNIPLWQTWVSGVGLVKVINQSSLTIEASDVYSGNFSFNYTVSDGLLASTTSVSGTLQASGTGNTGVFSDILTASNDFTSSDGWGREIYERELADVNGDGRADIVGFGQRGVYVAEGQLNGTFGNSNFALANFAQGTGGWGNEKYERRVADVNGDGRADVIGFGEFGVFVALAQSNGRFGSAFYASSDFGHQPSGWGGEQFERRVADVNGDGRADIIGFGYSATYVALGQGNGAFGSTFVASNDFGSTPGGWGNEQYERDVADVNGDGRVDIVGFGSNATLVSLGQQNGTFGNISYATSEFTSNNGGWGDEQFERRLGDVNGDGLADIVGFGQDQTFVAFGQASGLFAQSVLATTEFSTSNGGWGDEQYERRLADINGDGQSDIVGFGQSSVFVSLSSASARNFSSSRQASSLATQINVNDTPTAVDDSVAEAITDGKVFVIAAIDLLGNDLDIEGDNLTIVSVSSKSGNATVELDSDGNVNYVASDGFSGHDSFEYTVSDGESTSSAMVSLKVEIDSESYEGWTSGTDANEKLRGDLHQTNQIFGAGGNDRIQGGVQADQLDGGEGNDRIFGGAGDDTIFGGEGNDRLWGNSGQDTFVFSAGSGKDRIMDYETGVSNTSFRSDGDIISINFAGVESFEDLLATASQKRGSVIFDFGNGDELVLSHTLLAALDKDAFTYF